MAGPHRMRRAGAGLAVVAGVGMIVGSLLPWLSISGLAGLHDTLSGVRSGGDGTFTFFLGAVTVGLGVAALSMTAPPRSIGPIVLIAGLGSALVVGIDLPGLVHRAQLLEEATGLLHVSIGAGVAVVFVGALLAAVAGTMLWLAPRGGGQ